MKGKEKAHHHMKQAEKHMGMAKKAMGKIGTNKEEEKMAKKGDKKGSKYP